jgi:16S rRNA pseudouridine516 synthase
MQIQHLLFSQGFGTRRVCAGLVEQGWVEVEGQLVTDPAHTVVAQGLRYRVQGVTWLYQERAYLMLNKPAGYECSHRPGAWPSVYTLLPRPAAAVRRRPLYPSHDFATPPCAQGLRA